MMATLATPALFGDTLEMCKMAQETDFLDFYWAGVKVQKISFLGELRNSWHLACCVDESRVNGRQKREEIFLC